MPFEFGFPLREYQQDAIRAVEQALADERRSMLLAMATGTGKTKLAIALLYRLLATKRFRRICFVVDRSALGDQAAGAQAERHSYSSGWPTRSSSAGTGKAATAGRLCCPDASACRREQRLVATAE